MHQTGAGDEHLWSMGARNILIWRGDALEVEFSCAPYPFSMGDVQVLGKLQEGFGTAPNGLAGADAVLFVRVSTQPLIADNLMLWLHSECIVGARP